MAKFSVTFEGLYRTSVEVEAENEREAQNKALDFNLVDIIPNETISRDDIEDLEIVDTTELD